METEGGWPTSDDLLAPAAVANRPPISSARPPRKSGTVAAMGSPRPPAVTIKRTKSLPTSGNVGDAATAQGGGVALKQQQRSQARSTGLGGGQHEKYEQLRLQQRSQQRSQAGPSVQGGDQHEEFMMRLQQQKLQLQEEQRWLQEQERGQQQQQQQQMMIAPWAAAPTEQRQSAIWPTTAEQAWLLNRLDPGLPPSHPPQQQQAYIAAPAAGGAMSPWGDRQLPSIIRGAASPSQAAAAATHAAQGADQR